MEPYCKLCGTQTGTIFNIKFQAVKVCESCARSIFLQQAKWLCEQVDNSQDNIEDSQNVNQQLKSAIFLLRRWSKGSKGFDIGFDCMSLVADTDEYLSKTAVL